MDDPLALRVEEGRRRHEIGRVDEAELIYCDILRDHPDHPDGHHLLGLIALQRGQIALALARITTAIALGGDQAPYHNNLANALLQAGDPERATAHYRIALRDRPESAEIHSNLGAVLVTLRRLPEALPHLREACRLDPALPEGYVNLGNTLQGLGDVAEAEAAYRQALALRPDLAAAHHNFGILLIELGRWDEAEACYRAALALQPRDAQVLSNLGALLQEQSRLADAAACYGAALAIDPSLAEAHYNLGCALTAENRVDEAVARYDRALAIKPDYGAAAIARCVAELPILYLTDGEIAARRTRYEHALGHLEDAVAGGLRFPDGAVAAGSSPPFFLACQGRSDRALQARYGALVTRLATDAPPQPPRRAPRRPDARLRIGLVSGFFRDHTIWHLLLKGWLGQIDRRAFALHGYHTGNQQDAITRWAAARCERFVQGRLPRRRWCELIADDALDVLLYPEIGIDPAAAQLAVHRLAPVQGVAWGHPQTSGLPNVDYYLSSALMEPPDAAAHYTERLVRLPNLGTYYEPIERPAVPLARADLGLRPGSVVYWSGQALHKYLPAFDPVFPRIAASVGDCQFVFIAFAKSAHVTAQFWTRLAAAFAAHGLDAARHCVILPSLEHARFVAAMANADLVLDTIGWSGGKSSLESLTLDLPIVTVEGSLMRGRHTAAMLRRMAVTDTIAASVDAYVALAVQLGRDAAARRSLGRRVAAAKGVLYRDRAPIGALEAWLSDAVRAEESRRSAV
jgi:predicted O-linked N-acetylglucosamine transferase (SPINDLY family)